MEQVLHHPFHNLEHILSGNEAHFHIDLGKLQLAISPGVLVPIASGNLKVPVETGHHEDLLKKLRALGQGIEFSRMYAGRDEKIPGPFRGRLDEGRSFYFVEALIPQVLPYPESGFMADLQVSLHGKRSKIEVSVLKSQILFGICPLIYHKGKNIAGG